MGPAPRLILIIALREVTTFEKVRPYPDAAVTEADSRKPRFKVRLKNDGGGIGRVVVRLDRYHETAVGPLTAGVRPMAPEELRDALRRNPFEPFRLVMTDGASFDVRHPDLLWVGRRSAMIGLTGDPAQTLYERSIQVDLLHVIRLEPLEAKPPASKNGPAS